MIPLACAHILQKMSLRGTKINKFSRQMRQEGPSLLQGRDIVFKKGALTAGKMQTFSGKCEKTRVSVLIVTYFSKMLP